MNRPSLCLTALLALVGPASLASVTGCRNDPVPQAIIDSLPADSTPNGPLHRAGQPCLACHDTYGGATQFAVGGTLYGLADGGAALVPAANVQVTILDSNNGDSRQACTNAAGNFFILAADWGDITFPLTPSAAGSTMVSLVNRDGSCATCHRIPALSTPGESLDPVTGAAHDSAGAVLVDLAMTSPNCTSGQ